MLFNSRDFGIIQLEINPNRLGGSKLTRTLVLLLKPPRVLLFIEVPVIMSRVESMQCMKNVGLTRLILTNEASHNTVHMN